jgi:hypothetical protein
MKLKKNITLIVFFTCFISGCTSVKETLSGTTKKNTDEFLVKKKDPLVLPPKFYDLPKPQTQKNEEINEEESIDFSEVLSSTDDKKKIIKVGEGSLEKSISNILNNK